MVALLVPSPLSRPSGAPLASNATLVGHIARCELARQGDVDRIKLLLLAGCNVNAADYDKRTCLHLAASEGKVRGPRLDPAPVP